MIIDGTTSHVEKASNNDIRTMLIVEAMIDSLNSQPDFFSLKSSELQITAIPSNKRVKEVINCMHEILYLQRQKPFANRFSF